MQGRYEPIVQKDEIHVINILQVARTTTPFGCRWVQPPKRPNLAYRTFPRVRTHANIIRCVRPEMGDGTPAEVGIQSPRIRRRSRNIPHHAHELTFFTYRRAPVLLKPGIAEAFLASVNSARVSLDFDVFAYVVMPEHSHLLVCPRQDVYDMSAILKAVKGPAAKAIFAARPELRPDRAVKRPGRPTEFRFCQRAAATTATSSRPKPFGRLSTTSTQAQSVAAYAKAPPIGSGPARPPMTTSRRLSRSMRILAKADT